MKIDAVIESVINTTIGFLISFIAAPISYWMCNIEVSTSQNIGMTLFMTVISLVRGYYVRRYCAKHLDNFKLYMVNLIKK